MSLELPKKIGICKWYIQETIFHLKLFQTICMIDKYIAKEYPILKVNLTMMLNKYVGWIEHFFEGYVQFESLKVET